LEPVDSGLQPSSYRGADVIEAINFMGEHQNIVWGAIKQFVRDIFPYPSYYIVSGT
jgi:hypothetical protein